MKHFNQQLCLEGTFKTVVVNMKIQTHKYVVPKYLFFPCNFIQRLKNQVFIKASSGQISTEFLDTWKDYRFVFLK